MKPLKLINGRLSFFFSEKNAHDQKWISITNIHITHQMDCVHVVYLGWCKRSLYYWGLTETQSEPKSSLSRLWANRNRKESMRWFIDISHFFAFFAASQFFEQKPKNDLCNTPLAFYITSFPLSSPMPASSFVSVQFGNIVLSVCGVWCASMSVFGLKHHNSFHGMICDRKSSFEEKKRWVRIINRNSFDLEWVFKIMMILRWLPEIYLSTICGESENDLFSVLFSSLVSFLRWLLLECVLYSNLIRHWPWRQSITKITTERMNHTQEFMTTFFEARKPQKYFWFWVRTKLRRKKNFKIEWEWLKLVKMKTKAQKPSITRWKYLHAYPSATHMFALCVLWITWPQPIINTKYMNEANWLKSCTWRGIFFSFLLFLLRFWSTFGT